jgi:hypothetical protein
VIFLGKKQTNKTHLFYGWGLKKVEREGKERERFGVGDLLCGLEENGTEFLGRPSQCLIFFSFLYPPLLCSPLCPQTGNPPVSAFQVLRLQACTAAPVLAFNFDTRSLVLVLRDNGEENKVEWI